MNTHLTKTRSEQRIEQLINIGRPLTDEESDELYRALHADYMRKWRADRAAKVCDRQGSISREHRMEKNLRLEKLKEEAGW